MKEIYINCPCCNEDIIVCLDDGGNYSVVFFNEQISEDELFNMHGICFGVKGGDVDAK